VNLHTLLDALRRRSGPKVPAAAPVPPTRASPPPPSPVVDAYARSALEKAELKLVELDWRLRAVEAERDTHARSGRRS